MLLRMVVLSHYIRSVHFYLLLKIFISRRGKNGVRTFKPIDHLSLPSHVQLTPLPCTATPLLPGLSPSKAEGVGEEGEHDEGKNDEESNGAEYYEDHCVRVHGCCGGV